MSNIELVEYSQEKLKELGLNAYDLKQFLELVALYSDKLETSGTSKWFVPGTPLAIENYPKHREFFKAGALYKERLMMAANRVGKSIAGAFETACHLTGDYPKWWEGHKFKNPTAIWAAGKSNQTVRDTIQRELFGAPGSMGGGMIPRDRIIRVYAKPGTPNGIEMAEVKHVTGGVSTIGLKAYEQDVQAFYGTARDVIWLDEECPEIIYNECLIRTMTTNGLVYVTFTPLHGLTPFIINFSKNADYLAGAREIIADLGDEEEVSARSFR